jgi:hypothetical protein
LCPFAFRFAFARAPWLAPGAAASRAAQMKASLSHEPVTQLTSREHPDPSGIPACGAAAQVPAVPPLHELLKQSSFPFSQVAPAPPQTLSVPHAYQAVQGVGKRRDLISPR